MVYNNNNSDNSNDNNTNNNNSNSNDNNNGFRKHSAFYTREANYTNVNSHAANWQYIATTCYHHYFLKS